MTRCLSFPERPETRAFLRRTAASILLPTLALALLVGCTKSASDVAPVVTSFTPAQSVVGGTVVLTGSGFLNTTSGAINGVAITTANVNSDSSLSILVPSGAITGLISVTDSAGTGTSATNLTIIPQVTSILPASGPVGTTVVLTGNGFVGATYLAFGTEATLLTGSTFTVNTANQITAIVGSDATTGPVVVTSSGITSTGGPTFTVTQ